MLTFKGILTVTLTLFAVVDIIGSLPIIISVKKHVPHFRPLLVTVASGVLMVFFLFVGETFLGFMGIDVRSFALAGSIVLFVLAMEMILGINIFRANPEDARSGNIVPLAFPLIAGSGTLTTILSLRSVYNPFEILAGIVINLAIVFIVLCASDWIEEKLGDAILAAVKKLFGVLLLAIAIRIFSTYVNF
ncbi:MAG: MarC family protein [Bacteroidetes bacterium]|nr:MarC family protein [Bacteroidota bacterium]